MSHLPQICFFVSISLLILAAHNLVLIRARIIKKIAAFPFRVSGIRENNMVVSS